MNNDGIDKEFESDTKSEVDVVELSRRVSDMEENINQIMEQQSNLSHSIREKSDKIDKIEHMIDSIKDKVDSIDERVKINEGKSNSINSSLDAIEEELQSTKSDLVNESDHLNNRINAIENMLDLDETDIAEAIKPNACELEQLSTIPEESRKNQFTVRVQRAIALYENFHEISTPVKSGGERVLSKDIKTFLNGYSNTDIKYTQVQRVIDSFDEKTDDDYQIKKTEDGRAILWRN